jgi:lipopolysaccharide export LptBFGC system permease protein LptF
LVFCSHLFIAFGNAGRISPFTAAWGPIIVFFVAGLYLLWLRSTNRDLPKIRLPGLT